LASQEILAPGVQICWGAVGGLALQLAGPIQQYCVAVSYFEELPPVQSWVAFVQ
jgi:hypothetical protein